MNAESPILNDEQLTTQLSEKIRESPVILFMKGTPDQPHCGFSARSVDALDSVGASYSSVNVLVDPRIRVQLSALSDWPTIPQLFVNGTLVGGCDIITEMHANNELAPMLGK